MRWVDDARGRGMHFTTAPIDRGLWHRSPTLTDPDGNEIDVPRAARRRPRSRSSWPRRSRTRRCRSSAAIRKPVKKGARAVEPRRGEAGISSRGRTEAEEDAAEPRPRSARPGRGEVSTRGAGPARTRLKPKTHRRPQACGQSPRGRPAEEGRAPHARAEEGGGGERQQEQAGEARRGVARNEALISGTSAPSAGRWSERSRGLPRRRACARRSATSAARSRPRAPPSWADSRRAPRSSAPGVPAAAVDEVIVGHARQAGNGPNMARQVGRRAGLSDEVAGVHREQGVRVGNPGDRERRPEHPARREPRGARGRHRAHVEHSVPGARRPLGEEARRRAAGRRDVPRRLPLPALQPAHGRDQRDARRPSTRSRARSRTSTRSRATSARRARGTRGASAARSCRSRWARASARSTVEQGRALPRRRHARGDGEAQAGVPEGRHDHRRQRLGDHRRRGGAGRALGRGGASSTAAKPQARAARRRRRCGVDPARMGLGPVPAVRKLLERHGLTLEQIDVIELNEAFASQVLACDRELQLRPRAAQPQRRRHRARPPDRLQRHAHRGDAAPRARAREGPLRARDAVRLGRPGHGDAGGAGVGFRRLRRNP